MTSLQSKPLVLLLFTLSAAVAQLGCEPKDPACANVVTCDGTNTKCFELGGNCKMCHHCKVGTCNIADCSKGECSCQSEAYHKAWNDYCTQKVGHGC